MIQIPFPIVSDNGAIVWQRRMTMRTRQCLWSESCWTHGSGRQCRRMEGTSSLWWEHHVNIFNCTGWIKIKTSKHVW